MKMLYSNNSEKGGYVLECRKVRNVKLANPKHEDLASVQILTL